MSINFYNTIKKGKPLPNPNYSKHEIEVPFRMIIASGSGTGKTHSLCRLIYEFGKTWNEIIICIPMRDEPLYNMIEERLNTDKHRGVIFYENGEVPDIMDYAVKQPDGKLKCKDNLNRLIVFDDLMLEKKANKMIGTWFLKGRKVNFSCVYISQNYFAIPRDVRLQADHFMLGKNIQKTDINGILRIFSINLDLDKFTEIYEILTDKPLDTIMIRVKQKIISRNISEAKYLFNNKKNCMLSYNTITQDDEHGLSSDCEQEPPCGGKPICV